MKYLAFIISITLLFSLQSCQKDIIGEEEVEGVTTIEPTTTETRTTNVSGIVTDEDNNPLSGITITYSRIDYQTDENGYFLIEEVIADVNGGILYISEPGYFESHKFFIPSDGDIAFVRVQLVRMDNPGTFAAETGGTIEFAVGATVQFDPNTIIVESSGQAYNGTVNVFTHWYNPEDPFLAQSMPGDLRGLSADGQLVQLATYGMMAVELRSSSNEKLNLKDNTSAELTFPLPQDTRSHAPEMIPTWSLNEETLHWEEEDIATLEGNSYVSEVSHFSFWNCDVPYPLVNISGKLVNQEGVPLSYYSICIDIVSGGRSGYGWTDSDGSFRGKVPKNEALVFKVKDDCGQVVLERNIGPFANDASFGEIIIELESEFVISGQLQCEGIPIINGYARICFNEGTCYIAEVDNNGNFIQSILECQSPESLTVQGFDLENIKSSDVLEFSTSNSGNIEVGILEVCQELEEFIRFKINNSEEVVILDPFASIVNNNLTLGGSLPNIETSFNLAISDITLGNNSPERFEGILFDQSSNSFYEVECNSCDNIIFDITSLGGIGESITSTFMGEVGSNTVMGTFQVNIDTIATDLICDAILDAQEPNATIEISGGTPPYTISIDGMPAGSFNDNEFFLEGTQGQFISYEITDSNGETCNERIQLSGANIACIATSRDTACGENNGSSTTAAQGGIEPYTYLWSNGSTGQTITNLSPGIYDVTIVDAAGASTICSTTVGESSPIICEIDNTGAECNQDNGSATAVASGGSGNYFYEWSNGSSIEEINNLAAGTYTVTVTDIATGCETVCSVTINATGGPDVSIFPQDSIICNPNQLITANATNGTPPYTYSWNNGQTTQSIQYTGELTYEVSVTDSQGCITISQVTYFENPIDVNIQSSIEGCNNNDNLPFGTLTAEVIGGIPPFEYLWTNTSTTVTAESIALEYQEQINLIITDARGCTFTQEYIYEPEDYKIISGIVWEDTGGATNVLDETDRFLANIEVRLYEFNNLNSPIATVFTNGNNGRYVFEDVEAGNYQIEVVRPTLGDYTFVESKVGNNDEVDSEFNEDGFAEVIEFDGCQGITFFNAGLMQ